MFASALRSLVVVECDAGDGSVISPEDSLLLDVPLEGTAISLAWDSLGERVAVAVADGVRADRLRLVDAEGVSEDVALPAGAGATDVTVHCIPEKRKTWAGVSCTDGALRLIDASPGRTASVVRTSYSHGVAATAIEISSDGKSIASGSASGHVVVQPFQGSPGPTPLPGLVEASEAAIRGLRYSPLCADMLAACDAGGNIQVWDAAALRHTSRFPSAHRGAVRGLSFSTQNSDLLISGGDDASLIFWDVKNSRQIQQVSVDAGISALSYHSGGYLLASGTCDGEVLIFDLRKLVSKDNPAQPVQRFDMHTSGKGAMQALAFAAFDWGGARAGGALSAEAGPAAVSSVTSASEASRLKAAKLSTAQVGEDEADAPTSATLESMMGRLSSRYSSLGAAGASSSAAAAGATPSVVNTPSAREPIGRTAAAGAGAASAASFTPKTPMVPPLPHGTLSLVDSRQQRLPPGPASRPLPETPVGADGRRSAQVARYSIGSPADEGHGSPWWQADVPSGEDSARGGQQAAEAESAAAEAPTPDAAAVAAAAAEALGPLLAELRRDFRKEVQEAQCAVMEQNFRLHAELRKDLDELRAEVQQLRGELRVL